MLVVSVIVVELCVLSLGEGEVMMRLKHSVYWEIIN